jgi:hypothetical protein
MLVKLGDENYNPYILSNEKVSFLDFLLFWGSN